MSALRYHNRGPVPGQDRIGNPLYAFTANQDVRCEDCRRLIPQGETFSRAEWGQRSERFSRYPVCGTCRPIKEGGPR